MTKDNGLAALVTDIDLGTGPDRFDIAGHARAANLRLHGIFISGTAGVCHRAMRVEEAEFLKAFPAD